jgi:hypothetical protein
VRSGQRPGGTPYATTHSRGIDGGRQFRSSSDLPVSLRERQGGITRTRLVLPLCSLYHALLQAADAHGRIHKPTRVRWWLGVR